MLETAHARIERDDAVERAHPAQGPRSHACLRTLRFQDGFRRLRKTGQIAAFDWLHDKDRYILLPALAVKIARLAAARRRFARLIPIRVIELDHAEIPRIPIQQIVEERHIAVEREAQAADAPLRFLLAQIVEDPLVDVEPIKLLLTAQRVEHVGIEIRDLAAVKLHLKDLFGLRQVCKHRGRHLICQKKALAWIFLQHLTHERLRFAIVVEPGGIEVIDAMTIGKIYHLLAELRIDFPSRSREFRREPHAAKAEQRQLLSQRGEIAARDLPHGLACFFRRLVTVEE